MLNLSNLLKIAKKKKRRGRGNSSGHGNYAGRGLKGQNSRAGGGVRRGFEGGQSPLARKLPKYRGNSRRYPKYLAVNLSDLNVYKKGETVSPETLQAKGLINDLHRFRGIKILGGGSLKVKDLKINKCIVSKSAQKALSEKGESK